MRQHDPDRFFMTLLQPSSVRHGLWVLLAFNYEVAKTREVVSDPTLGYMRLQWWREALQKLYAGNPPPAHEVLTPLADVIRSHGLPFDLFDELIMAREFDLEGHAPADMAILKKYATNTVAPLTKLILRVCQQDETGADQISCAYGLAGAMRSIPFMAQQGRSLIPADMADPDILFCDQTLCVDVLTALHNEAAQMLLDAGTFKSKWLRLMGDSTRIYLCQMQRLDYDLRDPRFGAVPPFYHIRLLIQA